VEPATPALPAKANLRGKETLLLVEDAPAVRAVLRRALDRLGYTILEAADGQTALTLASSYGGTIDLLVSDAVLPELSGRHLGDRLRELRSGLRVIYMSGYAEDILLRRGALETWASYLQKPFTPNDLARRVREVLDAPEHG
jgi:CheY-like chemotaxis protein